MAVALFPSKGLDHCRNSYLTTLEDEHIPLFFYEVNKLHLFFIGVPELEDNFIMRFNISFFRKNKFVC